MKTFYCVTTRFFDSGRVKAIMYQIEANEKPQNTMVENNLCDQYNDYFDTYEEAYKFWEEAQTA